MRSQAERRWRHTPAYPCTMALPKNAIPSRALADFLTMQEAVDKPLQEVTLAFLGDGRSPIAPSLATGAAKLGMDFRIVSPPIFWPAPSFIADVTSGAHEHDGKFAVLEHVGAGVLGADFVYTAAWLGEQETGWAERIRLLAPFGVRADVMEATGNPGCKFMHCLPSMTVAPRPETASRSSSVSTAWKSRTRTLNRKLLWCSIRRKGHFHRNHWGDRCARSRP